MKILEQFLHFNNIDYVILAVILVSTLISLLRGFFKELISLGVWVVGLFIAIKYFRDVSTIFAPYIKNEPLLAVVSFATILILILIFGMLLNFCLSLLIEKTGLSGTDRILGMAFGFLRGVLLVGVVLLMVSTTSFVEDHWWKQSILIPHFHGLIEWLRALLPDKITGLFSAVQQAK
jgi:membrane protein required for colicin V production